MLNKVKSAFGGKKIILAMVAVLGLVVVVPAFAGETKSAQGVVVADEVEINALSPSWDAHGVYSAYYGPNNDYHAVSPGITMNYTDEGDTAEEAGIIKAGITSDPVDIGHYWDEGLFAFKPDMTIDEMAGGPLEYNVVNESGVNPVWMTIEIDAQGDEDRSNDDVYQYVPSEYDQQSLWHEVDAALEEGVCWEQWSNTTSGVPSPDAQCLSLQEIANSYTEDVIVTRVYLRLGMGDSYHDLEFGVGTVGWVDYVTIGDTTYDFVVNGNDWKKGSNYQRD